MNKKYSMVIAARHLFDSVSDQEAEGYLCIRGPMIVKKENGVPDEDTIRQAEQVLYFDEELVMPGIVDTHTFFTGYAVFHLGADVSKATDNQSGLQILKAYESEKKPSGALFGHGWNPEKWSQGEGEQMLEAEYPEKPVILFAADRSSCIMNRRASERYHFTSDSCYPESYYRIMREYLNDRDFIQKEFAEYMHMMNSRGVTTVKEMGFDDFYGFTDFLKEMEDSDALHLRTFFMSQPVGERMNLEYAKKMRDLFTGDKVRFSGFNRMTDGTIAAYKGDLKSPYENESFTCNIAIPYDEIEADVLAADAEGFRWSLHAQGDGAVGRITEIYDKCQKVNGKLKNRHALTDMEFTDPKDLEKLGDMGVTAELYFQIMSLDPGTVLIETMNKTIGKDRGRYYWNRRKMQDSGICLSGATDLPLLITSIPESVFYSCGGYMDGLEQPFQPENTLTVAELLKAWTIGGQKNIGMEHKLGTLEAGKLADIAVFDRNLLKTETKDAREACVVMTMMDGRVVYTKEADTKKG